MAGTTYETLNDLPESARGQVIDATDDLGDRDSADICTEISRGVDKWLWFVEAHAEGAVKAHLKE